MDYTTLITSEHSDKPNFMAMVAGVTSCFGDIATVNSGLVTNFDIDSAIGIQLDIIGQWLGQPRLIPDVLFGIYFGFDDQTNTATFGEDGQPQVGARFYEDGDPISGSVQLADIEYRQILKARITKNQASYFPDAINLFAQNVLNTNGFFESTGDMSITVCFGVLPSLTQQAIIENLDLIPRPAGVKIKNYVYFQKNYFFGFDDTPNALGFGDDYPQYLDGSYNLDGSRILNGITGVQDPNIGGPWALEN